MFDLFTLTQPDAQYAVLPVNAALPGSHAPDVALAGSTLIVYVGGDNLPNPPKPKSESPVDSSLIVYIGGNNFPNPPKPK